LTQIPQAVHPTEQYFLTFSAIVVVGAGEEYLVHAGDEADDGAGAGVDAFAAAVAFIGIDNRDVVFIDGNCVKRTRRYAASEPQAAVGADL
jgi:hypothetical protein